MEPGRFFYSINGTDVHGPVTDGDVRQLWLDNRIGPTSFLCRAGELTWAPCDPMDYPPRPPRVRTMVIVPSQMMATLLAAEKNDALASSPFIALEEPPGIDLTSSKRVTIRLTSPPELLAKAPEVSRSRSLRGALVPRTPLPTSRPPPLPTVQPRPVLEKPALPNSGVPAPVEARGKPAEAPTAPARPPPLPVTKPSVGMEKATGLLVDAPVRPAVEAGEKITAVRVPEPAWSAALTPLAPAPVENATTKPPVLAREAATAPASPLKIPPLPAIASAKAGLLDADPLDAADEMVFDELGDEGKPADLGAFAIVLNFLGVLAAVGAAVLAAFLAHPGDGNDFYVFAYRSLIFVATFLALLLIPFVISRFTEGDTRVITRSGGIVVLAVVVAGLCLLRPPPQLAAQARAISEQQKQEAQKEIATKGYYSGNSAQAEKNIENLKSQLTDDSDRSRIGRAILTVTSELLDKVKSSDVVEKSCKFTLEGVKTADDLTQRSKSITRLHAAQSEVITFLEKYDQYCHEALASDNIAPEMRDEISASARKGAHIDLLLTLWQQKMKLSDDYVARFDFLRSHWGGWEFKDGEVNFSDDAQTPAYESLVQAVQDDIERIREAQRQIFK